MATEVRDTNADFMLRHRRSRTKVENRARLSEMWGAGRPSPIQRKRKKKKKHLSRLYHFGWWQACRFKWHWNKRSVCVKQLRCRDPRAPNGKRPLMDAWAPHAKLRHPTFNQERLFHRWTRRITTCPIWITRVATLRPAELLLDLAGQETLPHQILHDLTVFQLVRFPLH